MCQGSTTFTKKNEGSTNFIKQQSRQILFFLLVVHLPSHKFLSSTSSESHHLTCDRGLIGQVDNWSVRWTTVVRWTVSVVSQRLPCICSMSFDVVVSPRLSRFWDLPDRRCSCSSWRMDTQTLFPLRNPSLLHPSCFQGGVSETLGSL